MLFVVALGGMCCFLILYRDCVVCWYNKGTALFVFNNRGTVQFVGTIEALCTLLLH
jgi:hypothetical protein